MLGQQLNQNSDDGCCNTTSDTIDPHNGRQSEKILRKSVKEERIQAEMGTTKPL